MDSPFGFFGVNPNGRGASGSAATGDHKTASPPANSIDATSPPATGVSDQPVSLAINWSRTARARSIRVNSASPLPRRFGDRPRMSVTQPPRRAGARGRARCVVVRPGAHDASPRGARGA